MTDQAEPQTRRQRPKSVMKDGIVKRGDRYYVGMREKDPVTGKSKLVWHSGFLTRQAAKEFRDERRMALRRNAVVTKSSVTVAQYMDDWMAAHFTTKQLKPSTQESYREQVEGYIKPRIGSVRLQDLTAAHVERLYADLLTEGGKGGRPLSPRTVELTGTILRMALKKAVTIYKLISSNPAADVDLPRPRKGKQDTWNADEMRAIVKAAAEHPLGAMFILGAATGARRGELLGLRWSNVDFASRTVTFQHNRVGLRSSVQEGSLKNDEVKTVTVDEATMTILQLHRKKQAELRLASRTWDSGDYVFCNNDGSPLHPRTPHRVWQRIVAASGVKYLKPHAQRHTHATLLLEEGVPLHVVAKRLGHRDAMVTATIYAHVTPKQEDAAAGVYGAWLNREEGESSSTGEAGC